MTRIQGPARRSTAIVLAMLLLSCSLALGVLACSSAKEPQPLSQQDPRSTLILFAQRLDSNDVQGAIALMAHPSGRLYVIVEQYDLRDEIARLQRVLGSSHLTLITSTAQSEQNATLNAEFDYTSHYRVDCVRVDGKWYISAFSPASAQAGE